VILPPAPRAANEAAALLHKAAEAMLQAPGRSGCTVYIPEGSTITVSGDLHDNLPNLARIAAAADLHEPTNHVVVQELIHGPILHHGCDLSHRMLVRVAALILAHRGQVHALLGNHELAQLLRRGVSKGGGNSVKQFEAGLDLAFGDDADLVSDALDAFITAMPLAIRTADGVCCAHSMPEPVHMGRFDETVFDRAMTDDDRQGPFGSAYLLTWGRRYDDDSLGVLAQAWGVDGFLLGHVHAQMGAERRGERALILNSEHERGVLLKLRPGQHFNGQALEMAAIPLQMLPVPDGALG
jgi:hypothetical protein